MDLRESFDAYGPGKLRHYWRLGEDLDAIGADWVQSSPVHLDQAVGIDASDVVSDAP